MASLNLSINGPSIKSSYAGVVNAPAPSSSSPTAAQWALFSVQAPLLNAFQDSGAKESILKVESTGDGDLAELIEDFSEGRIQFAFAKLKDPNSGLPKNILIAWCGGGVPERTKGYFTSHLNAVAKVLHGYHVQITARSDADLEPATIIQKVADASGSKYSAGASAGSVATAPPPIKSKPVFPPTTSGVGRHIDPIVAARTKTTAKVDDDGWGDDAPPVTRTEIQKVESAYRPTKVNMAELTRPKAEAPRITPTVSRPEADDIVKGGYQPVGKVDIAALRAQGQKDVDNRPTPVKGAYEPVGAVDIAAIRAKAQRPATSASEPHGDGAGSTGSRPLADRAAAFSQAPRSERLTSMPKPKIANKFGGSSSFTGTKAPAPGGLGFGAVAAPAAAPVGTASRTFADQGGKTPAQIWAEKKARQRGESVSDTQGTAGTSPIVSQKSGSEWKSGYSGKSWAPVQTSSAFGRPDANTLSAEHTGNGDRASENEESVAETDISALRDRFKDVSPTSTAAPPPAPRALTERNVNDSPPPPIPSGRPSGGFALPGLPARPAPDNEDETKEEDAQAYEPDMEDRAESPVRIAIPVSRGAEPAVETLHDEPTPPPLAPSQIHVPDEKDLPDEEEASHTARAAASHVAAQSFQSDEVAHSDAPHGGNRAIIHYDYDKAEGDEIDLVEGEYVTNVEMIGEDWWMGTNSKGENGLFPSDYVKLVDGGGDAPGTEAANAAPLPAAEVSKPAAARAVTAISIYAHDAAEDNELSFPEDATITELEFPDEDWWYGSYGGHYGLFPADYVQLNS